MLQHLQWTGAYYKMRNVKRDGTKHNSNLAQQTGAK